MTKRNRVARPKGELEQELKDQLSLLRSSCERYDQGLEAAAKHLALTLRLLLHHHGQSRSLLEQLGMRATRFYATGAPFSPKNLLPEFPLVLISMTSSGARYAPLVAGGFEGFEERQIAFVDWWNETVLRDDRGKTFCRRQLVEAVANTDGGAHVDPELDEDYMRLSRENSLGFMYSDGQTGVPLSGKPELAYMRQIAHEVLLTIHSRFPAYEDHSAPVIPHRSTDENE